jgi:hypothetical protein
MPIAASSSTPVVVSVGAVAVGIKSSISVGKGVLVFGNSKEWANGPTRGEAFLVPPGTAIGINAKLSYIVIKIINFERLLRMVRGAFVGLTKGGSITSAVTFFSSRDDI